MRFNIGNEEQNQNETKKNPVEASPEKIESFLNSASKLEALKQEIEEQKCKLREQFRLEFTNIVKDFFEAVPEVKSVTWTQYTPYFCDGDPCYFGVNEVYFASDENEDFEVWRDEDEDEEGCFSGAAYSIRSYVKRPDLCEKLSQLIEGNEDIMEDIFGDHVAVRLTVNGTDTREYEHD